MDKEQREREKQEAREAEKARREKEKEEERARKAAELKKVACRLAALRRKFFVAIHLHSRKLTWKWKTTCL